MKPLKEFPANFWSHCKLGSLESQEKLLLVYLISHPTTNRLGCLRWPIRYMTSDLEWPEKKTRMYLNALIDFKYVIWDAENEWLYIRDFLDWFPIKNRYQAKYIEHAFNTLPSETILLKVLVGHLLQMPYLDKHFREQLVDCWQGASKREIEIKKQPRGENQYHA